MDIQNPTPSHGMATPSTSARHVAAHLLTVAIVAFATVLPAYWFDWAQELRPTRALGMVGVQLEKSNQPVNTAEPLTSKDQAIIDTPNTPNTPNTDNALVTVLRPSHDASTEKPGTGLEVAKTKHEDASAALEPNLALMPKSAGVEIEGRENLDSFFKALRKSSVQPVRIMHYGDSTLAGDGIAKTVRGRMKSMFGDAGPGFFVAGMDPRWMRRDDVRIVREGVWDIHTILFGGNQGRYGLGGVVAKAKGGGNILVTGPKVGAKLGQRTEIYTNKSSLIDAVRLSVNGAQVPSLEKISHPQFDQWVLAAGVDVESLKISIVEPGLEVYGAVIEGVQGITWETTAVVGVASGSVRQFNPSHLAEQTAARRPELIVIMLGGNETGHPGLFSPDGAAYKNGFSSAVRTLKQGAPQAACLIMSPLDQGVLADNGQIYSRKTMPQMVKFQREVSQELGCAFWDSWQFMGGSNSFSRWLQQGLAWTDLVHLTDKGLTKIGNGFGDALMSAYRQSQEGR